MTRDNLYENAEEAFAFADVDSEPSRLLTLPAEVRNIIFDYVLTSHHIHIRYAAKPNLHWAVPRTGFFYHHLLDRDRPPPFSSETALLTPPRTRMSQLTPLWLVCKQLYVETIHIPFCPSNVFSFEDHSVFATFMQRAKPEQTDGIKKVWIGDDSQSATFMELLQPRFTDARLGSRLCDMTVYIHSRINRMEAISNTRSSGPLNTFISLRAGWDLAFERKNVNGLREMWEKLVSNVVVREV